MREQNLADGLALVPRALRWRDGLLLKLSLVGLFAFAIVVALCPDASWGDPFRTIFRVSMTALVWVLLWLMTMAIDCGFLWLTMHGSDRRKLIAAGCLAGALTGWFLIVGIWRAGTALGQWAPAPIWMQRAHFCLVAGSFSVLLVKLVIAVPLPPGRVFRETLRLPTAILVAFFAAGLIWTHGLEQRGLVQWIDGVSRWIVPVVVLVTIASFFLFVSLTNLDARRARRKAYGTEFVRPHCRRCRRRMEEGFRDVTCPICKQVEPLPREWWLCECGAPLRGLPGNTCPECGGGLEEDLSLLPRPDSARRAAPIDRLDALLLGEGAFESSGLGCYPLRPMTLTATGPVVWIDGRLVSPDEAMVSVYDHGLLYGDGIFEGIRVYGGRIFKMKSHLDRLWGGCEAIRLTPALSRAELEAALREAVSASGLKDAYIRLVLTRGKGSLGLNPNHCPKSGTIIIVDRIHLYPPEMYEKGMPIIVAKRPRIPAECLDPAIKSLNYLNNILAKVEAIDAGVHEAIMLNTQGFVSECTGDNIFVIKGGAIATPPVSAGILRGVTRRFVIDTLAPTLGLKVAERPMKVEEVLAADEVFLTGTAAEVIGVGSVDGRTIGTGVVGPITKRLEAEFKRIVAKDAPED